MHGLHFGELKSARQTRGDVRQSPRHREMSSRRTILSRLSSKFGLIECFGERSVEEAPNTPPTWFNIEPRFPVQPVRPLARAGGHPMSPVVRLVSAGDPAHTACVQPQSAIWQI